MLSSLAMTSSPAVQILLVEAQPDVVSILSANFKNQNIENSMIVFRTAEEAVHYLYGRMAVEGAERHALPDLMVLDLQHLSEKPDEIVRKFQDHHDLRLIPLIVIDDTAENWKEEKVFYLKAANDTNGLKKIIQKLQSSNKLKK